MEEEVATEALPEPEAEPAAAAPPSGGSNKASMQWVVTAKMESQLWSATARGGVRPSTRSRAAAIIKHSDLAAKGGRSRLMEQKGQQIRRIALGPQRTSQD